MNRENLMDLENVKKLRSYLVKMIDFAHAIKLDETSSSGAEIALTMSEEIKNYGEKALESLSLINCG